VDSQRRPLSEDLARLEPILTQEERARAMLETLNPARGFVASLVVEGPVSGVRRRRWRGR
jgi:hypothetical protein